jgi:hypothetical protein
MGYRGLQAGIDALQGKTIDRFVDTGVTIVTPTNVDSIDTFTLKPQKQLPFRPAGYMSAGYSGYIPS